MPAQSKAQQRLFAIAEHNPEALKSRNKSLADLPDKTLHEFAATKTTGLSNHVRAGKRIARKKS